MQWTSAGCSGGTLSDCVGDRHFGGWRDVALSFGVAGVGRGGVGRRFGADGVGVADWPDGAGPGFIEGGLIVSFSFFAVSTAELSL